ncbi:hypothetical protein ON006_20765 [Dyadobacter pollutisoli]|uniref:Uncharacterized protein n=1 Tax=Dyadobacter pollutisoli TaxID=2910158 RepID=A0A9E8N8X1_9BACT|nr:hypothetical protein [Dyadobacter pollutisoli]WAC10181.1 hypothetical protein ON006_20765 [Dyadobacter pollutisoli]
MNKSEKDIRKQIKNELRKKASDAFEASLPTSRIKFEELFNYLDEELQEQECDNKPTLARTFLENQILRMLRLSCNGYQIKGGIATARYLRMWRNNLSSFTLSNKFNQGN